MLFLEEFSFPAHSPVQIAKWMRHVRPCRLYPIAHSIHFAMLSIQVLQLGHVSETGISLSFTNHVSTLLRNATKFIECTFPTRHLVESRRSRTLDSIPIDWRFGIVSQTCTPAVPCRAQRRTRRNNHLLCTQRALDRRTFSVLLLFSDD